MSYDEHLISMAGGDGDVLDQIQRRIERRESMTADGSYRFSRTVCGEPSDSFSNHPRKVITETGYHLSYLSHLEALADHAPTLLAMVREQRAVIDAVMAVADINMDSEHGDPAFISGWQAALEEVQTRITEAVEERPVSEPASTLLEDTDPATVFDVRLSVTDAVDVIEDGLRNDSMEDLSALAFNIWGLLIDANRAALTTRDPS